jgi:hypothetical protein
VRALALAAALAGTGGAAEAGGWGAEGGRVGAPNLWVRLLAWAEDWSGGVLDNFELPGLDNATEEEGSSIDPNGTNGPRAVSGTPIDSTPPVGEPVGVGAGAGSGERAAPGASSGGSSLPASCGTCETMMHCWCEFGVSRRDHGSLDGQRGGEPPGRPARA